MTRAMRMRCMSSKARTSLRRKDQLRASVANSWKRRGRESKRLIRWTSNWPRTRRGSGKRRGRRVRWQKEKQGRRYMSNWALQTVTADIGLEARHEGRPKETPKRESRIRWKMAQSAKLDAGRKEEVML